MSVSRTEGYKLGAPKEREGIETAKRFFAWATIEVSAIVGDDNRTRGDLEIAQSSKSIEVKGQRIRPKWRDISGAYHGTGGVAYYQNFIEICEHSTGRNEGGLLNNHLFDGIDTSLITWEGVGGTGNFDDLTHISYSLNVLNEASAMIYCNNETQPDGRFYLCAYSSQQLINAIRERVKRNPQLGMGKGDSNAVTLSVLAPYPTRMFWFQQDRSADWKWCGKSGNEGQAMDDLKSILGI
jgi:hypothetical protein